MRTESRKPETGWWKGFGIHALGAATLCLTGGPKNNVVKKSLCVDRYVSPIRRVGCSAGAYGKVAVSFDVTNEP